MQPANLTGRDESHLCSAEVAERLGVYVHRDVVVPFDELRSHALTAGFDVAIESGFRTFDKQLSIWNRKAHGELAVLDSDARPIDISTLSEHDLVFAILRWSALPGASRHHWGTDLDVFDAAARPAGYSIELVPSEYDGEGMFSPFSRWFDEQIAHGTSGGFFRPYDRDRNGVAPERWHVSYGPLANEFLEMLTVDVLRQTVEASDMLLKRVVLANLDEIMDRFVKNVNPIRI
jgi:LAS superfamily LD-carboxypeptidase LdcB